MLRLLFKYLAAYLLPLNLPRRRKLAMTLLTSTIDPGALTVFLVDETILLTELPILVDAISLCFVLTTVLFAMSMIQTMFLVWWVDCTPRKLFLLLLATKRALTTRWSSASRTLSRRVASRRWFTKLTKKQLFGQPLKKLFDALVDQEFSNHSKRSPNCLLFVNLHQMAKQRGQSRHSKINSGSSNLPSILAFLRKC